MCLGGVLLTAKYWFTMLGKSDTINLVLANSARKVVAQSLYWCTVLARGATESLVLVHMLGKGTNKA